MSARTVIGRVLAVALPLALGAAAIAWFLQGSEPLPRADSPPPPAAVRVVAAVEAEVAPRARGFGTVRPGRVWTAVAEVGGRVVEEHPDLEEGATIRAGERLLQIDPTDYRRAIAETRARIDGVAAEIEETDVRAESLRETIAIREKAVDLARRRFERDRRLADQGTVPEQQADQTEEAFVAARADLQALRNDLAVIPARRKALDAQRAELESILARRQDDLADTTVTAPFDMRLAEVSVETDQVVQAGEALVTGDGVARAEVPAELPLARLRRVLASAGMDRDRDVRRINERLREADLAAVIRLAGAGARASWRGRLVRLGDGLSRETRTVQAILRVDDPYGGAGTLPLVKGMYVSADVVGRPRPHVLVPRAAIEGGHVLVADGDDRLARRAVETAFVIGEIAALAAGLEAGARVVLDDVQPAVEGRRLAPETDAAMAERLAAVARSGGRAAVEAPGPAASGAAGEATR